MPISWESRDATKDGQAFLPDATKRPGLDSDNSARATVQGGTDLPAGTGLHGSSLPAAPCQHVDQRNPDRLLATFSEGVAEFWPVAVTNPKALERRTR